MMSTPLSAPPQAPFAQRQLSPIPDEVEHYSNDSAKGRHGLDRKIGPPPFDADTKLADWPARSAERRAANLGVGGEKRPT